MGIDLATYRIRIGCFSNIKARCGESNTFTQNNSTVLWWHLGVVLMMMLVIGGIEMNPGPRGTGNSDGSGDSNTLVKMMKAMEESQKKFYNDMNMKFDKCCESWNTLNIKFESMKTEVEKMKPALHSVVRLENTARQRNMVIFGLDEINYERKWDCCAMVLDLFANELNLNLSEQHIDNVYRLGRSRRGRRPILVSFVSTLTKDYVMSKSKMLKGTSIRFDNDYDFETRKRRRELVPYLQEARRKGQHAVLIKDKLRVNGRIFDYEYCINNLKTEPRNGPNIVSERNHIQRTHPAETPRQQRSLSPTKQMDGQRSSPRRNSGISRNGHEIVSSQGEMANFRLGDSQLFARREDDGARAACSGVSRFGPDDGTEILSSPQGSLLSISRMGNYNLRNWVVRK